MKKKKTDRERVAVVNNANTIIDNDRVKAA